MTNGNLTTNGKIYCMDSIKAQSMKVTDGFASESINTTYGYITILKSGDLCVNTTSVPSNFKVSVSGKSYFSDFVGIGTSNYSSAFKFGVNGNSYFTDFVGIGMTNLNTGYKLAVDGGILCEEVKVIANVPSSDYVFEKDYNLRPLAEVEAYVAENKHLPEVPSAKEFKEKGYKVGDMDDLLLRKIEELTLYIIEQQKQIDELQQQLQK